MAVVVYSGVGVDETFMLLLDDANEAAFSYDETLSQYQVRQLASGRLSEEESRFWTTVDRLRELDIRKDEDLDSKSEKIRLIVGLKRKRPDEDGGEAELTKAKRPEKVDPLDAPAVTTSQIQEPIFPLPSGYQLLSLVRSTIQMYISVWQDTPKAVKDKPYAKPFARQVDDLAELRSKIFHQDVPSTLTL